MSPRARIRPRIGETFVRGDLALVSVGAGAHGQARGPTTSSGANGPIRSIAMLGNHLPRRCGIATFTTDLLDAILASRPDLDGIVVAMNDADSEHAYPERVRFEIPQADLPSYRRATDYLNFNHIDVLSVQHEYGIFGGKAGAHVLALLRELRMPIVTTLHTVLPDPSPSQRAVMDELTRLSERVVVMSTHGADLLAEVHHVSKSKIDLIPHGIPDVPSSGRAKHRLGLEGKTTILTFGLLSPDKGIEHMIEALPAIRDRHPDAIYVVLGATHPHVKREHGETYRLGLEARARKLGVASSVVFHDRFVSAVELAEFMAAADVYVTPYLNLSQITSGTLAYAVGSGRAVVSTPYPYAQELLAEGRGVLVPRADPGALATALGDLLADVPRLRAMRDRATAYGARMGWPVVAGRYVASFDRAGVEHAERMRTTFQARTLAARAAALPDLVLTHLETLTDGTGLIQHADFDVPRYQEGYCLDDNARALLLMALIEDAGTDAPATMRKLATRYLAFVRHAFDEKAHRFRNFLSYERTWTERTGSDDCHGRALWALGTVVGRSTRPGAVELARGLLHSALPLLATFSSPRAWAYTSLGLAEILRARPDDHVIRDALTTLAARLLDALHRARRPGWPWFEDDVTYANARLPQALMAAGDRLGDQRMIDAGLETLGWLVSIQGTCAQVFAPVGANGFYPRGGPCARFDQQPLEAGAMVSAALEASRITRDPAWMHAARWAFDWYLGQNQLEQALYDPATGGCRDGLHADRVNENQGAESTLSFLLALVELREANRADAREARGSAPPS